MQRTIVVFSLVSAVVALAGCAGGSRLVPQQASPVALAHGRGASDAASGMPGDAASGMPGDAASGLPGDAASGMPGDAASGLPGDAASGMPGDAASGLPGDAPSGMPGGRYACVSTGQPGAASCTIALNLNVPPVADPMLPAAVIAGFHPDDLAAAYALPREQGAGRTVAIVDAYDSPSAEADLAVYRAAFGLPPCTTANGCFRKVNQRGTAGAYPAPNAAWAQETSLDLDMVSAACPRCSILLVEADSALIDDLGASVDKAVSLGAFAVSNSYYAPEWSNELAEGVHYNHPGVAITVSSGDHPKPSYPAASRFVTAVGGTSLRRGSWSETPWAYAGHGCSAYVRKPAWQGSTGCRSRSAVDVSVVADPQTGVSMFDAQAGGWLVAGGTSVGAPLVAAAYALSGNPAGPGFSYQHPAAFRPIGSSGYTVATGLGSPLGVSGL